MRSNLDLIPESERAAIFARMEKDIRAFCRKERLTDAAHWLGIFAALCLALWALTRGM